MSRVFLWVSHWGYADKQGMVVFLKELTSRTEDVLRTLICCYWPLGSCWPLSRMCEMWRKQVVTSFSDIMSLRSHLLFCLTWWLSADPTLDRFQVLARSARIKAAHGTHFILVTTLRGSFVYNPHLLQKETKAHEVKKWAQSKMLISSRSRNLGCKAHCHSNCYTLSWIMLPLKGIFQEEIRKKLEQRWRKTLSTRSWQ